MNTVAEIVCAKIAENDPAHAVTFAEQYASTNTYLLENLVYQWSQCDPAGARAYVLAKHPGEERDRLLARLALTLAKQDPIEAAKLVAQKMTTRETQLEAGMSVVHQWALRNPTQALVWVDLFTDG